MKRYLAILPLVALLAACTSITEVSIYPTAVTASTGGWSGPTGATYDIVVTTKIVTDRIQTSLEDTTVTRVGDQKVVKVERMAYPQASPNHSNELDQGYLVSTETYRLTLSAAGKTEIKFCSARNLGACATVSIYAVDFSNNG